TLRGETARKNQAKDPLIKTYDYFYSNEFPDFSDWISFEMGSNFPKNVIEPSIIKRGYYSSQIQDYYKFFPRSAFLFIDFEDFKEKTFVSLNEITDFLKISKFDASVLDIIPKNKRNYTEYISEE